MSLKTALGLKKPVFSFFVLSLNLSDLCGATIPESTLGHLFDQGAKCVPLRARCVLDHRSVTPVLGQVTSSTKTIIKTKKYNIMTVR